MFLRCLQWTRTLCSLTMWWEAPSFAWWRGRTCPVVTRVLGQCLQSELLFSTLQTWHHVPMGWRHCVLIDCGNRGRERTAETMGNVAWHEQQQGYFEGARHKKKKRDRWGFENYRQTDIRTMQHCWGGYRELWHSMEHSKNTEVPSTSWSYPAVPEWLQWGIHQPLQVSLAYLPAPVPPSNPAKPHIVPSPIPPFQKTWVITENNGALRQRGTWRRLSPKICFQDPSPSNPSKRITQL